MQKKVLLLAVLFIVPLFSFESLAATRRVAHSPRMSETDLTELAKALATGALTGGISGYFSSRENSVLGSHFRNFFFEKIAREGFNEISELRVGYGFYAWVASWVSWGATMLYFSTPRHTIDVGVPTMVASLMLKAVPTR